MGLLLLLVFKQNLCSLRAIFLFNKIIRDFSLDSGVFQKLLFDKFVACNLSVYLLGLALANPCLRHPTISQSVWIEVKQACKQVHDHLQICVDLESSISHKI